MNTLMRVSCRGVVARRWHSTEQRGREDLGSMEQFAAEQSSLPARDADRPGSGAQQAVRSLYRDFLRESQRKLDPDVRDRLEEYIRARFRADSAVPRRQFAKIEWMLRQGRDQLDVLRNTDPMDGFNLVARS
eukprot:TRINITY_DN28727_c0_g1_i1.p1 TRINITY_DN28727_c0_g1~~TRINITY_DN28727_c0_g1_i1.p1  ORF type:complete len:132 (+),score=11.10 TRINITY_DN28727_c0_g1_i1:49-444(+)